MFTRVVQMARVDWVRQRLESWGRWARERESGALGYPKKSSFLRVGSGARASSQVLSDGDDSVTDSAVQALRYSQPHLHKTLHHYYVQAHEIKRVAVIMGRAESTIKAHLEAADHAIAIWFRAREQTMVEAQQAYASLSSARIGAPTR